MILISACLLGIDCKYNGENNSLCCQSGIRLKNLDFSVLSGFFIGSNHGRQGSKKEDFQHLSIIPVCPEQLGGLSTPRPAAEIKGGHGQDVLAGLARVVNKDGKDVTKQFIKGAYETLKIAETLGATKAILKARSPSCGAGKIYNGNFNGTLSEGNGVTTALLKSKGIEVYNEEDFLAFIDSEKLKEDICNG